MANAEKARGPWFGRFWEIGAWDLNTRKADFYKPIVQDVAAYDAHMAVMREFFSKPIDMFPFGNAGELNHPPRFYKIEEEEIAERFPGGAGAVGDEDARALLRYFADLFQHNIIWLVIFKKAFLAIATVLLLIAFFNPLFQTSKACLAPALGPQFCPGEPADTVSTGLIGLLVVSAIFGLFFMANESLTNDYRNLLERSAQKVNVLMAYRTSALKELFEELLHQIDARKTDLNDAQRKEWPKEAGRWMVVAYWASQRLEYIERFVQIQMWRVRRAHFFVNRAGFYLTWVMAALSGVALLVLVVLQWASLGHAHPIKLALTVLAAFTIALMNYLSYAREKWRTPLSLVKESLGSEKWRRYADLDMQEKLYKTIHSAKQDYIEAEESRSK